MSFQSPAIACKSRKMTQHQLRLLYLAVLQVELSSNKLFLTLKMNVTNGCVKQLFSRHPHIKFRKIQRAPLLTTVHRKKWLKWARRMVSKGDHYWVYVMLSHENLLKLDGPYGF